MSWDSAIRISNLPPMNYTVLNDLDAGTDYDVRVRGVSEFGAGAWSIEPTTVPDNNASTLSPSDSECV